MKTIKLTVKQFMKKYNSGGNLTDYCGSLKELRIAKNTNYTWSLIAENNKLYVISGYHENAITYVSSSIPRKG